MSKKINNDAMGQLLEGLTSSAVSPVSASSDSTTISESRNNSQEEHKDSSKSVRSKKRSMVRYVQRKAYVVILILYFVSNYSIY